MPAVSHGTIGLQRSTLVSELFANKISVPRLMHGNFGSCTESWGACRPLTLCICFSGIAETEFIAMHGIHNCLGSSHLSHALVDSFSLNVHKCDSSACAPLPQSFLLHLIRERPILHPNLCAGIACVLHAGRLDDTSLHHRYYLCCIGCVTRHRRPVLSVYGKRYKS
jgi:hypothetical protein